MPWILAVLAAGAVAQAWYARSKTLALRTRVAALQA